MFKDEKVVGAIFVYRQDVRPFSEKQVELLKSFAAQAVIAIENTRLLNELRQRTDDLSEALEQQTATSEVLKVISSSPGELQQVFEAMLENATRICEASFGNLLLYDGKRFQVSAMHRAPPAWEEYRRRNPNVPGGAAHPLSRVAATKRLQHIADSKTEDAYVNADPQFVPIVDLAGARSIVAVPMLKDNELVGAIVIYRQEVRPFTHKQIELVQNFASQAVIAIENTRLLNELRERTDDLSEALEQQTATSEVLGVISSSPSELDPVFDAILENATHICGAEFGALFRHDDGQVEPIALHNVSDALEKHLRERGRIKPRSGSTLERLLLTRDVVHVKDLWEDVDGPDNPASRFGGARSYLGVPMLKDNKLIGAIVIYRQEIRPFTDKQIALVQNFAAQAVIAIENTRLLNELPRVACSSRQPPQRCSR